MQRKGLFKEIQSGFRINHSIETGLITNDLPMGSDSGLIPALFLLDLSAAFSAQYLTIFYSSLHCQPVVAVLRIYINKPANPMFLLFSISYTYEL